MKRLVLIIALSASTLALSACTSGGGKRPSGPPLKPVADPSAVIAAEVAFNRLAQDKGQWTAFRETAAPGAVMFVPQRVLAADWLKDRADPPTTVRWRPRAVWSSCDGTLAVTHGDWQRPGATGSFATVWQRQSDGRYKWTLDMSLASERPVTDADTMAATVADCDGPRLAVSPDIAIVPDTDTRTVISPDGSLRWTSVTTMAGARRFALVLRKNGQPVKVLDLASPPQP